MSRVFGTVLTTAFLFSASLLHAAVDMNSAAKVDSIDSRAWLMSAGTTIGVGEDKASPGLSLTLATRMTDSLPLYGGADVGALFLTGEQFAMGLMALPTAYFRFQTAPGVYSLLGMSVGPVFGVGDNIETLRLGLFLKPGLSVELSRSLDLTVETRIGLVGGEFYVLPNFAASFWL